MVNSWYYVHLIDIDECFENLSTLPCDHLCNNTIGGFDCSCEEGFMLLEDGRSCEGVSVA